jgi:hypothetical protein
MVLQGVEVVGDRQGVVRVGDRADVSIWAYQDQGVMAVCACRVPGIVNEAAWPDQVGPDDVGLEVVECCGAAFTSAPAVFRPGQARAMPGPGIRRCLVAGRA